jgi:glycosyltransferase involved in cell wall biosynthesis
MSKEICTVAVDLTPVLPGGENGGAKIFVLELLRTLAELKPQVNFVLLTQSASHEELGALDRVNVRRHMVLGATSRHLLRGRLKVQLSRVVRRLPGRVRGWLAGVGYKINSSLKRRSASRALLHDLQADLLFCPFTAPTYFELGIPTVCTVYDLQYKTYPEFFSSMDVVHRDQTFLDACRRATALTAISDYSRNSAIAHGKIDPGRIRTIYLRMAQRNSPSDRQDSSVLSRLALSPRQYLIYPANFWKHKNHAMLLTAFGMACRENLPSYMKLVCTGAPGPQRDWLMSAAGSMELGDRVVFPGFLPDAELAALMANAAGVVFPSLYEGFGLPVIEAMAAGVPVACSNTTALPEVASDAAILFDPRIPTRIAEALISLVKDEALRVRLIAAGLQRALEFSDATRMAKEYWELFEQATASENVNNLLTGVYSDGWTGSCLDIQVAPSAMAQTLEIELQAPDWLPQKRLTVRASSAGQSQYPTMDLDRGTHSVLSLPLKTGGGTYQIRIGPTFVHGEDPRELSAMLLRCALIGGNGEYIDLYPQKGVV